MLKVICSNHELITSSITGMIQCCVVFTVLEKLPIVLYIKEKL